VLQFIIFILAQWSGHCGRSKWQNDASIGIRFAMIALRYPFNGQAIGPFVACTSSINKRLFSPKVLVERCPDQSLFHDAISSN
jgi:hypothetical protein